MGTAAVIRAWFARESPRPLAALRIVLGIILLCEAASRWPFAVELYSSAGPPMPVFVNGFRPPVPSPDLAIAAQTLFVFSAVCIVTGWQTRVSLITAALMLAWLGLLDLPGTFKKYSVIEIHLLVLTASACPAGVWSLDARRHGRDAAVPLAARWPRRLIRILMCAIYLGAAATKIRLAEFASGDLLEFALLDDLWGGRTAGRWLASHTTLLQAGAIATLAFESFFPLLVWIPRLRRPMLVLAALFHLALHTLLHLGTFSWVMLCGLMAFLDERDFGAISRGLRTITGRRARDAEPDRPQVEAAAVPSPSPERTRPSRLLPSKLVYALTAGVVSVGGVATQRLTVVSGDISSTSPAEFREVADDDLDEILAAQLPSYADMVRRLELGTRIVNSHAVGDASRIVPGTTLHALVRFIRQRPPMTSTWILADPEGREIGRLSKPLSVDVTHATAAFELPEETPAGRYRIILQLDGVDATRAQFDVTR